MGSFREAIVYVGMQNFNTKTVPKTEDKIEEKNSGQ